MALTVANVGRGNYVLGGLGRVGGPSAAEAMDLAQQREQEFRNAQRTARETEQRMALAQAQEARTQQEFEAQRAARAAAQARAGQQRAAFEAYTRAATAGPAPTTAGVRRPVDNFVTPTAENPFPLLPTRTGVGVPLNVEPPAGVRVGAPRGRDRVESPVQGPPVPPARRSVIIPELGFPAPPGAGVQFPSVFNQGGTAALAGGGGADTLAGGGGTDTPTGPAAVPAGQPARAEFGGVAFDVYPDGRIVNTLTNTELPMTGEFDALRSVLTQQVGMSPAGVDSRAAAAQTFGESVRSGVGGALDRYAGVLSAAGTGLYGLYSDVLGPVAATVGATDLAAALERQSDIAYNVALTNLRQGLSATAGLSAADFDMEPETFRAAVRQAEAAFEAEEPAERTGQDPFIVEEETPTGPIAGLSPAGATNPVAATEAAAAAAPDQDPSAYFMSNPNLVLDLQEQLARERQVLEARLQYAQQTGNMALFDQTFDALNSKERVINENMITGQIAILAAQQDNFGPLQEFMQRAYPNDDVQVIPYTNGTVSFFVNGQEDGAPTRTADLLDGLARTFNTEYREALATAAQTAAERETFLFENAVLQQLQAAREISVAQARILAELEATYGEVTPVGDLASGDKLFQTFVPERGFVQFRIVEAGEPLLNGKPAAAATVEEIPPGTLR